MYVVKTKALIAYAKKQAFSDMVHLKANTNTLTHKRDLSGLIMLTSSYNLDSSGPQVF